jgi:hypothetical protein
VLQRKDLIPHIKHLRERISRVKAAWDHDNWTARPSGLCRAHCGVTECSHCGGGR